MPVVGTKGAMSSQGFGEFAQASGPVNYIEDVFSTYLYTGNGTSQTIINNIDLSTKGGMTWIKARSNAASNAVFDTNRGANVEIQTNTTNPNDVGTQYLTAFTTSGFSVGSGARVNTSTWTYASWTFRKQPKFFDVVTYTGNGVNGRTISHNLGSTPACMFIKQTSAAQSWRVYHSGMTNPTQTLMVLDSTSGEIAQGTTVFGVSSTNINVYYDMNTNGQTYVAYLFASDAGGFGLTGTDNVITCGSMTTSSLTGKATATLGYEPQFVITKAISTTSNWITNDSMRGMPTTDSATAQLYPNLTNAEASGTTGVTINSTGFSFNSGIGGTAHTYIYIAIRRGPMKVPTDATKVFAPTLATANAPWFKPNFVVDTGILASRSTTDKTYFGNRLRGSNYLNSSNANVEFANGGANFAYNNGWNSNTTANSDYVGWNFQRAPSFHDVVCYTGTGSATTVTHNLSAVPELMIFKQRSGSGYWPVYDSTSGPTKISALNATGGSSATSTAFNDTAPTSTVFTVGTLAQINTSGQTYVAYLFATCAGVSKVGSYTGNGSTQTINCGFTGGARFVLVKRIDATGAWYVYDTARGMTTTTDPYLQLQSTAAETATLGSVTTVTTGFAVDEAILAGINTSGGTYIFLAIA